MKILPLLLALFFIVFLCVTGMLLLKINSLEERVAGMPRYAEVGQRFADIESKLESVAGESYRSSLNHHERLIALETGIASATGDAPVSIELLLNSLQSDWSALRDIGSDDPDRELGLRARVDKSVAQLVAKHEDGEDVLGALFREIRMSEESLWRGYLIREITWQMGPAAVEPLMKFFRDRKNAPELRALAAESLTKAGGRKELKEFATHLLDRTEDLTVKTRLATIFKEHPISAAEEGLIEGVRGVPKEDGTGTDLYIPQYRYICIEALGALDTPRVVRFLELLTDESCAPDPQQKKDVLVAAFALHAYHRIMGEEAVDHFEDLKERYNLFDTPLGEIIDNLIKPYSPGKKPEDG